MAIDRMQKQRFELKYLISEETALRFAITFRPTWTLMNTAWAAPITPTRSIVSIWIRRSQDLLGHDQRHEEPLQAPDAVLQHASGRAGVFRDQTPHEQHHHETARRGAALGGGLVVARSFPELDHLVSKKNPNHLMALQRFSELTVKLHAKPRSTSPIFVRRM